MHKKIINLSINYLAFYWSFPELVASKFGYYEDEGLHVIIHDVTPKIKIENKSDMYVSLQKKKLSEIFHAAEYVSINRVLQNSNSQIVAFSPWSVNALNGSFGIFVRDDDVIENPTDLDNKEIAVEAGTGSYYTTIDDLEKYMDVENLKFKKLGDPHERLISLINNEVSASSLLGIYAEMAPLFGLRKLIDSTRRRGTLMVAAKDLPVDSIQSFITATNRAISNINKHPENFTRYYCSYIEPIFSEFPKHMQKQLNDFLNTVKIPEWDIWQTYPEDEFDQICNWLTSRNLLENSKNYDELVNQSVF